MHLLSVWHRVHLAALSIWGAVVAYEGYIEFRARRDTHALQRVARLHGHIDRWLELPTIGAILLSGVVLTVQRWPMTPLHWVKITSGLGAIAVNLWCAGVVFRRERNRADIAFLHATSQQVRHTLFAVPLALVAFLLGIYLVPVVSW